MAKLTTQTSFPRGHPTSQREATVLPCPEFDFWLHAIVTDNYQEVDQRLSSMTPHERNVLLNGRFEVQTNGRAWDVEARFRRVWGDVRVSRPWCLAAVCNAPRVSLVFLRYGVDVCRTDEAGFNVLHCLVYFAYLNPPLEEDMKDTFLYLKKLIVSRDTKSLKTLLKTENESGFRPLEMAAHLCTMSLFLTLFETEGMYLSRHESLGLYSLQWFNITPYESMEAGSRRHVSPLRLLAYLEDAKLKESATRLVFSSDLFQSWIASKLKANMRFIRMQLFLRLAMLMCTVGFVTHERPEASIESILYILCTRNTSRDSHSPKVDLWDYLLKIRLRHQFFMLIVFCYAICVLIFNIYQYLTKNQSWLQETPKGKKKLLHPTFTYHQCHVLYSWCMLLLCWDIFRSQINAWHLPLVASQCITVVGLVCCVVSTLYSMQIVPSLGVILAVLQRAISDFAVGGVLYALLVLVLLSHSSTDHSYLNQANATEAVKPTMAPVTMVNIYSSTFQQQLLVTVFIVVTVIFMCAFTAHCACSFMELLPNKQTLTSVQKLSLIFDLEDLAATYSPTELEEEIYQSFTIRKGKVLTPRLVLKRKLRDRHIEDRPIGRTSKYNGSAKANKAS